MAFPDYMLRLYGSRRAFKQEKRRQTKDLVKAFRSLYSGSAYLPADASRLISKMHRDIDELQSLVSLKEWGR